MNKDEESGCKLMGPINISKEKYVILGILTNKWDIIKLKVLGVYQDGGSTNDKWSHWLKFCYYWSL